MTVPENSTVVPIERLFSATDSGLDESQRLVIRDQSRWDSMWHKINANRQPTGSLPAIDFSRSMVIIAALGRQTSGGYAITIEGVYRAAGQLYVVVQQFAPGADCMVGQALSAPVDIVRLPNGSEPVVFIEQQKIRGCS